jgi:DNA-binding MarR family transcriptional regulator
VTRLIDRLERRGLVERARVAEDRRLSITRITRAGLDLLKKIDPHVHDIQRRFTSRVATRDLRELSRICEEIYDSDSTD